MRVIDEYQMLSITPLEKLMKLKNTTKNHVDVRGEKSKERFNHSKILSTNNLLLGCCLLVRMWMRLLCNDGL